MWFARRGTVLVKHCHFHNGVLREVRFNNSPWGRAKYSPSFAINFTLTINWIFHAFLSQFRFTFSPIRRKFMFVFFCAIGIFCAEGNVRWLSVRDHFTAHGVRMDAMALMQIWPLSIGGNAKGPPEMGFPRFLLAYFLKVNGPQRHCSSGILHKRHLFMYDKRLCPAKARLPSALHHIEQDMKKPCARRK